MCIIAQVPLYFLLLRPLYSCVVGSGSEGVDTQGMLDVELASDEEENMPSIFLPSSRGSKSHNVQPQSPASFLRFSSAVISITSDLERNNWYLLCIPNTEQNLSEGHNDLLSKNLMVKQVKLGVTTFQVANIYNHLCKKNNNKLSF